MSMFEFLSRQSQKALEHSEAYVGLAVENIDDVDALKIVYERIKGMIDSQQTYFLRVLTPDELQRVKTHARDHRAAARSVDTIQVELRQKFRAELDAEQAAIVDKIVARLAAQMHQLEILDRTAHAIHEDDDQSFTEGPGVLDGSTQGGSQINLADVPNP